MLESIGIRLDLKCFVWKEDLVEVYCGESFMVGWFLWMVCKEC